MKAIIIILCTVIFIDANTCHQSNGSVSGDCIDSSKIDPSRACTREYNPVCGCDSVTYPNPCEAEKQGITHYRMGPCSEKK